jgi:hypothetical protein
MALKAIRQFQLRMVMTTEKKARETLHLVKDAGYEGIELNSFMIHKIPLAVCAISRLAGMLIGGSGRLDWKVLVVGSGLRIIGIHEDLGRILRDTDGVVAEATAFGTEYIVVTGVYVLIVLVNRRLWTSLENSPRPTPPLIPLNRDAPCAKSSGITAGPKECDWRSIWPTIFWFGV